MTKVKIGLFAFAIMALGLTGLGFNAEQASAAPGNGAYVFDDTQVYDLGGGYVLRIDVHDVFNVTFAKSGNLNINGNFKYEYRYIAPNGDVLYAYESSGHSTDHWKFGEPHVFAQHYTSSDSYGGITCTYESDFHMVDGVLQFGGSSFVCS